MLHSVYNLGLHCSENVHVPSLMMTMAVDWEVKPQAPKNVYWVSAKEKKG